MAKITENAGTVTVRAVVPLQESFARLLKSRSRVLLSETIRYPGETVALDVSLLASGKEIFRHHRLRVELATENGTPLRQWFETTDDRGNAFLVFELEDINPGQYHFRVWDISYQEWELQFNEEPILSILEFPVADDADVVILKKQKLALQSQIEGYSRMETEPIPSVTSSNLEKEKHGENNLFEMRSGP